MRAMATAAMLMLLFSRAYADPPSVPTDWPERVSLARSYVTLTRREEHLKEMFAVDLKSFSTVCAEEPTCIAASKAAADFAAGQAAHSAADRSVYIYAKGLTVEQLLALVQFISSPEGHAYVSVLDETEDQRRLGAHADIEVLLMTFHDHFCATQEAVCGNSQMLRALPGVAKAAGRDKAF
jgi:hypothetical protein